MRRLREATYAERIESIETDGEAWSGRFRVCVYFFLGGSGGPFRVFDLNKQWGCFSRCLFLVIFCKN